GEGPESVADVLDDQLHTDLTRSKSHSAPSPLVGEGWGGGCLFDSAEFVPPSRLARCARKPTSPTSGEVTGARCWAQASLRVAVARVDDIGYPKARIDEFFLLHPGELVGDARELEHRVGLDIGQSRRQLLGRQIGVFAHDLEERPRAIVEHHLAVAPGSQQMIVEIAGAA